MQPVSMRSLTVCVLKPQLVSCPWARKRVLRLVRLNGFRVETAALVRLSLEQATQLYAEHERKFFYGRLLESIRSGPVVAYILSREDAIKKWRELLGPTQVYKTIYSHPFSIRGQFGLTDTRNAAHGSDSPESVVREIKIFFPKFSVDDWYLKETAKFNDNID